MDHNTNSTVWFITAYFQFIWRSIIIPLSFIWKALVWCFSILAKLAGGSSSSSSGSRGGKKGGLFDGVLSDLKNIEVGTMDGNRHKVFGD